MSDTAQSWFDRSFSSLWENPHDYNGSSLHPSIAASVKKPRTQNEVSKNRWQVIGRQIYVDALIFTYFDLVLRFKRRTP